MLEASLLTICGTILLVSPLYCVNGMIKGRGVKVQTIMVHRRLDWYGIGVSERPFQQTIFRPVGTPYPQ